MLTRHRVVYIYVDHLFIDRRFIVRRQWNLRLLTPWVMACFAVRGSFYALLRPATRCIFVIVHVGSPF
ncbi:hypothetical protein BK637_24815 [Pseudomonas chlororaphis]|nr:hypothetical protein BK637_24815 [Pseudomonas chlororaphis]